MEESFRNLPASYDELNADIADSPLLFQLHCLKRREGWTEQQFLVTCVTVLYRRVKALEAQALYEFQHSTKPIEL